MEALAALSIATSIVQFIDFGCKLYSTAKQIYESEHGATQENLELRLTAERLNALSTELKDRENDASFPRGLVKIAGSCNEVALKLESLLACFQIDEPDKKKKREAVKKTLKRWWHKEDVKDLVARLENARSSLILELVNVSVRQQEKIGTQLGRLCPSLSPADIKAVLDGHELIGKIEDIGRFLREDCKSFSDETNERLRSLESKITSAMTSIEEATLATKVLSSLDFAQRTQRFESIDDAHSTTYEWILSADSRKRSEAESFKKWLQCEPNGIYWITGLPGSGKSTMMKFLHGHPEVMRLLEAWTGDDRRLVITEHYLWIAGHPLQRSREGLLKAIMYRIIADCPALTEALVSERIKEGLKQGRQETWTKGELLQAIAQIKDLSLANFKFCFFIDGLDEYDSTGPGGYHEMVNIVNTLGSSEHIKVVAAGRPYDVFRDNLITKPRYTLQMHLVNDEDIRVFVKECLQSHPRLGDLSPFQSMELENDIVGRAEGVFLWIILAIQSISGGLDHRDPFHTLQNRLKEVPKELEELFNKMLEQTESVYRHDTVKIYRILLDARNGPVPVSMLGHLFEPYWAKRLSNNSTSPSREQWMDVISEAAIRVEARCKDLVYVQGELKYVEAPWSVVREEGSTSLTQPCVTFLHRTVFDFLKKSSFEKILLGEEKLAFDPQIYACQAWAELSSLDWISYQQALDLREQLYRAIQNLSVRDDLGPFEKQIRAVAQELEIANGNVLPRKPHEWDLHHVEAGVCPGMLMKTRTTILNACRAWNTDYRIIWKGSIVPMPVEQRIAIAIRCQQCGPRQGQFSLKRPSMSMKMAITARLNDEESNKLKIPKTPAFRRLTGQELCEYDVPTHPAFDVMWARCKNPGKTRKPPSYTEGQWCDYVLPWDMERKIKEMEALGQIKRPLIDPSRLSDDKSRPFDDHLRPQDPPKRTFVEIPPKTPSKGIDEALEGSVVQMIARLRKSQRIENILESEDQKDIDHTNENDPYISNVLELRRYVQQNIQELQLGAPQVNQTMQEVEQDDSGSMVSSWVDSESSVASDPGTPRVRPHEPDSEDLRMRENRRSAAEYI